MSERIPVWKLLRRRSLIVLATFFGGALLYIAIDPLRPQVEIGADDIAEAWSQSISRLGILPVFPPEEDLYVGDLWAVIVQEADDQTPLLGKAVRLAHIDLREEIAASRNRQPVFSDTSALISSQSFRRQPNAEVGAAAPGDPITLTLTAFPGVSIRHGRRVNGSLSRGAFFFGASRDDMETEEIRIPMAETYGVPVAAAAGRLDAWCRAPETAMYCDDAYVRRVLAFALGQHVLVVGSDRFLVRLQLQLVTRVFATREIEHHRSRLGSGAAQALGSSRLSVSTSAAQSVPGTVTGDDRGVESSSSGGVHEPAAAQISRPATLLVSRSDGAEFVLRQSFQRPVIFGFRAVTVALRSSTPSQETVR